IEGASAVLVRQADASTTVAFKGSANRYHNLDGYWPVGDGWQEATWARYQGKVPGADDSRVLLSHPWKAAIDEQMRALEKRQVKEAFQLNDRSRALRTTEGLTERLIGPQALLNRPCVPERLVVLDEKTEAKVRRYLVVDGGEG